MISRVAASGVLLLILSGAVLTSTGGGGATVHTALGALLAALIAALAVRERTRLTWTLFALVAIECVLVSPAFKLVHAILSQLIFAVAFAIAAPPRECPPEALPIRRFVVAMPPLVLLQTALGAAYRHKVWGVLPHMAGAMVVVLLALLVSVILLQRLQQPQPLRLAATALISVLLVQISLGIAAFLMRLLDSDQSPVFTCITVAHVVTGALTLGASVALARFSGIPSHRPIGL